MSWKDIGDNQDGGDATHYGGLDTRKIMRLFNGVENVDNVFFNSNVEFRQGKLWLKGSGNFSAQLNAGSLANNVIYSFPAQNSNDQVLLANASQTITGKTINAANNTIIGVGGASSSSRKSGRIQAPRTGVGGSMGEGLLQNHIDITTPTATSEPPPYGLYWLYTTGTTQNTNTGLRYAAVWARRQFNPRIKIKSRTPGTAANSWFLFGLSFDQDIEASETAPIDNDESAFLLGWRNTDGSIMVFRNSGTNTVTSSPTVVNTGQTKPTEVTTWEIDMRPAGDVLVNIVNAATGATIYTNTFSTNLPTADRGMRPVFQLKNTDSLNHDLHLYYMELEQDM